jgi:xanthine/uracil/vitamin C permease (AzgA family)
MNKTLMNSDFTISTIVLSSYIAGWLVLFSVMFDKKVKLALEKSLWILCIALLFGLLMYRNPSAIVLLPSQWLGSNGVFALPSFKEGNLFVSSSLSAFPSFFKSFSHFIPALLSLLVFHLITYVCTFFTIQQFQCNNENREQENLFKKGFLFEGISSIFAGVSGSASTLSAQGTCVNVLSGAKTGLSSVVFGLISILGLFIIPLLSFVFIPSTSVPILLAVGILLLYKALTNIDILKKEVIIPFLVAVLISIFTQDIVFALTFSLFLYAIIASIEKSRVSLYIWVVSILLIIFEFLRIVIPFFYISM